MPSTSRLRKLRNSSLHGTESGFTMIELLVVVIIIAILAAVAVPVYVGIQNNAKKSAIQSDVATTKLNVAAIITEDGNVASGTFTTAGKAGDAQVQNSKATSDETITVTVNPDKSFTVVGSSASADYQVSFDSTSSQSTTGSAVKVIKAWDFTKGSNQGWSGVTNYTSADGLVFQGQGGGNATKAEVSSLISTTAGQQYTYNMTVAVPDSSSKVNKICIYEYNTRVTQACSTNISTTPVTISLPFTATGSNSFPVVTAYYPDGTRDLYYYSSSAMLVSGSITG